MKTAGFDWDDGNWPKCGKHGVTQTEIEEVLLNTPAVMPDPHAEEPRMRAIGKTSKGRYVFLVFMIRQFNDQFFLRPISARFMHQKEIDHYEIKIKIKIYAYAQKRCSRRKFCSYDGFVEVRFVRIQTHEV